MYLSASGWPNVTVSYWDQVVEFWVVESWHTSRSCIAHDILPYWDIRVQNLKH